MFFNITLTFILSKIDIDLRFVGDTGNDCLLSVDCTDCEILEPWPYLERISKKWCSQKFNGPGVKYEIAIVIKTGHIAWVNGPYKAGKDDYTIFKEGGLLDELEEKERGEADAGYRHPDPEFC